MLQRNGFPLSIDGRFYIQHKREWELFYIYVQNYNENLWLERIICTPCAVSVLTVSGCITVKNIHFIIYYDTCNTKNTYFTTTVHHLNSKKVKNSLNLKNVKNNILLNAKQGMNKLKHNVF